MLVSIITPTTGNPYLKNLLISLNKQSGLSEDLRIEHFIVIDGKDHSAKVFNIINEVEANEFIDRVVVTLPFNSGGNGYLGFKIYASFPQFVNGDYTVFMDEDNEFRPSHISQFTQTLINEGMDKYDWMYSLRFIVDDKGKAIYPDLCESLGYLNSTFYSKESYLIDTSCFFVKTSIVKNTCFLWNRKSTYDDRDPDRVYTRFLMRNFPKFKCITNFSVRYRVLNEERREMFKHGNEIKKGIYGDYNYFQKPIIYLAHFTKEKTDEIINRINSIYRPQICFNQYLMNMFDQLRGKYLFMNAYDSPYIPSDSVVFVHMCNPEDLPYEVLQRKDLIKILSTVESPNIRHKEQWDLKFIHSFFTHVMTFWEDIIKTENFYYHPFSCRYDLNNNDDLMTILDCEKAEKDDSVCILLENRPFRGDYTINGVELEALDYQRLEAVKKISEIKPVFCYGQTWRYINVDCGQNAHFINTPSRFLDTDRTIDFYKKHKYTLIIENCNAKGYVSEKIYDAWASNSIPIYGGSFTEKLKKHFGSNIPIDDMFIKLDEFNDVINDEARINKIYENIKNYKQSVIEKVGIYSYNQAFQSILGLIRDTPVYSGKIDKYINSKYFKYSVGGKYLEYGGKGQNTNFFKNYLGWSGVLVESNEEDYEIVKNNNKAYLFSSSSSLTSIAEDSGLNSLDLLILSGTNEKMNLLNSFNFLTVKVKIVAVENEESDDSIKSFLEEKGFGFLEKYENNEIYILKPTN